jgi:hypothetical protein
VDLTEFQDQLRRFVAERGWQRSHGVKNLGIARRAKRIRWYSRPREFQSLLGFSPLMRRFLVTRSKVRLTSDQ